MDTPVINGTAYPKLEVEPKAYRFRILNAAHDVSTTCSCNAVNKNGPTTPGAGTPIFTGSAASLRKSQMVPAEPTAGFPGELADRWQRGRCAESCHSWSTDFIQIGSEGGFLPEPAVFPTNQSPGIWTPRPLLPDSCFNRMRAVALDAWAGRTSRRHH